ncbi:cytochrome P450 sterol C22-desaturase [Russula aff. rugulosa BPL654]|nr:cytochrome P450 sterol C22-desaturase [Russula aff. rugulosa BPL654]
MTSIFKVLSASVSVPSPTSLAHFSNIHLLSSPSNAATYTTLAILFAFLVLEQSVYRYKKKHLPGDIWTIPIIGKFTDSMKPTMEGYRSSGTQEPSVPSVFIVMASSTEYSRKILNSPAHAEPCLVYSAKQVLLPENWVFLTGKEHVAYRRVLNNLFTHKALGLYFNIMDSVTRKYIKKWLEDAAADPTEKSIMMTVRDLNMETSLRVFCGNHLPDEATREISEKYWAITVALELVNFPFALPGTKIYRAIQARKAAFAWLELAAKRSKEAMSEGKEPQCMLDEWVTLINDPAYKGRKDFSDREMAMVVFSFLFASQDAMSSGLIYGFQHLADHPDILANVREEQNRVRPSQHDRPMTLEDLDQMPYLKAVVKESLRVKPPVTMVPYLATKPFPISDTYTVPPGSMVIPSFYNSLHDPKVFPKPDSLAPERWLDPENSANKNPQNYLVFGSGPHKCIGIEYATMNIALVLALASELTEWEHVRTQRSEKVQIIATIFPQDGCLLKFTPR